MPPCVSQVLKSSVGLGQRGGGEEAVDGTEKRYVADFTTSRPNPPVNSGFPGECSLATSLRARGRKKKKRIGATGGDTRVYSRKSESNTTTKSLLLEALGRVGKIKC